ncbi:MAG: DNA polymerase I [Pseudomonadota bacterium]|nr:DNA polymerase I [Pseudomonadota bacterium]MEC7735290.1 DNA polymerase I [Pseudomonadota bacterium]MEC9392813.1 DNA polymerase I [Pseudomonadota bacterium]MEC9459149.1 DNA polymerase I [Pseudomonadota bacterium]MEC9481400.1 DNA polymerase I [Pseudomonadota bacterium]|tara:strand:+ start:715 stop:3516 length:2802 start_codon:yes stop_codon:yes gene_type:complete
MNKNNQHICLVDGSTYIFRAYHALPPLTRKSDGFPVGAISGFCNMLDKLVREEKEKRGITHIVVVFDASGKTFRNEIYKDYKANRSEAPEDLVPQFPVIRQATSAFNIPYVELMGFEADDLIASYAKEAEQKDMQVTIVSSDKDLMQLVSNKTSMLDTMKGKLIDKDGVFEKFGVYPEKVIDVQSLAGDSVDNIPGIPGIGIKTAALLINEYGDLNGLFKNASSIKQNKRRENIIEFEDQAYISKKLVTLKNDIPLPISIEETSLKEIEPEKLIGFLKEMEFKTLTEKKSRELNVDSDSIKASKNTKKGIDLSLPNKKRKTEEISKEFKRDEYKIINSKEELLSWYTKAEEQGFVAFDTETNSLDAVSADMVGFSLCTSENDACYVPLLHTKTDHKQLDFNDAKTFLKELLEDESIIKILHNMKFDALVLAKYNITIENYDDTMLLSYSLGSGGIRHKLDTLIKFYFDHEAISFKELIGSGKDKKTFQEISINEAGKYAAEDADMTLRLWKKLKALLIKENQTKIYEIIEKPLAKILMDMEKEGISINIKKLKDLSKNFENKIQKISKSCFNLINEEINLASPKQVGEILFDKLVLPGGKKTSTGSWSTDAEVLENLANAGHEFPKKLLEWRALSKLKTTYTDALPNYLNEKTKRIHTSFAMATTSTGRLASSDPNLQNIPIRSEDGRMIRKAFVPEKGNLLISSDYSQIELRLIAHIADERNLKNAFLEGKDIHASTASEVFNVPIEDMKPETRRNAKAINFGIIYGISAFGLAKQLNITRTEASEYIKAYFNKYPAIKEYMEETKKFAVENGYVKTLLGRKCIIEDIKNKNPARRSFMERAAINAPIQGSAADIIKRAMILLSNNNELQELNTKMLLQVHDELIFETKKENSKKSIEKIREIMEAAHEPLLKLSVPLITETNSGENWDEAH